MTSIPTINILAGLLFLTGCAPPWGNTSPPPDNPVVGMSPMIPSSATNQTVLVVPHIDLKWQNNYSTNSDGTTVSNEYTVVEATDDLGEHKWQKIGLTQEGFWVQAITNNHQFYRVRNIIQ